jgi:hypothetical protein
MNQLSIYAELYHAAAAAPGGFAGRNMASESVSEYLGRLARSVLKIPDSDWDKLTEASQAWCDDAAGALNSGSEIKDCPGCGFDDQSSAPADAEESDEDDSEDEEEPDEQPEEDEPEEAPIAKRPASKKPAKKAKSNKVEKPVESKEKPAKAAKKTSKNATANADRKARLAEKKAAEPAKPAEKKAPKAKKTPTPIREVKAESLMQTIRRQVILNPDISTAELKAKLVFLGWDESKLKPSSLSTTRGETCAMINLAKELGLWKVA